ncbi:MAG: DUF4405 domain-containing protein [Phycisphaerales bacterium]
MAKQAGLFGRPLVTPVTTASFVIVALTGVLMLVDVKSATIKELHEMVSILFVVAAGVHLALNWNCFASYLRKPLTIVLGVVVVVLVVLMFAGSEGGSRGGRSPMEIFARIEAASLAQVAPVLGIPVEESVTLLKAKGLQVSSENESIADIAKKNDQRAMDIISSLLAAGGKPDR